LRLLVVVVLSQVSEWLESSWVPGGRDDVG